MTRLIPYWLAMNTVKQALPNRATWLSIVKMAKLTCKMKCTAGMLLSFLLGHGTAMADDVLDLDVSVNKKTHEIILGVQNISNEPVFMVNSLAWTDAELRCLEILMLNCNQESLALPNHGLGGDASWHAIPSGVAVKVASEGMRLLSASTLFPDGYAQNRVLVSQFINPEDPLYRVELKKGVKYVRKTSLYSLLRGLGSDLEFDPEHMSNLYVKIRFSVFATDRNHMHPPARKIEKETDWIKLDPKECFMNSAGTDVLDIRPPEFSYRPLAACERQREFPGSRRQRH
ncbi:MAG: hypothetical protein LBP52_02920 [Burkholderiaceae bacterium]|jgi:hypothetical protein|nr:hypothetical protein [Burkholderiaceae bacterium]